MQDPSEPSKMEMEPAEEVSAEYDEAGQPEGGGIAEQNMSTRPQRQRRPPQILAYNSLGNPQYQRVEPVMSGPLVNSTHAPWMTPAAAAVHFEAPLYCWVWPVCSQPMKKFRKTLNSVKFFSKNTHVSG